MKISDTKAVEAAKKKKKTSKAGAAEKAKFASLVESAMEKGGEDTAPDTSTYGQNNQDTIAKFVPEKAEERGVYMLDTLEALEKDILSGNPTDAIARLKEALETKAVNVDQLSPKMRQLLDEINLRASIEVAKMED